MTKMDWERARRRLAATQGFSRASMRHSQRKTSPAQLRYMRTLAIRHRIDVGPACCASHSSEWITGTLALASEGHYRRRST